LNNNYKLKPVHKLDFQSTHKQKYNVVEALESSYKNIRKVLRKVFQDILHFIYCPNFRHDELTIHTDHCLGSNCSNYQIF